MEAENFTIVITMVNWEWDALEERKGERINETTKEKKIKERKSDWQN